MKIIGQKSLASIVKYILYLVFVGGMGILLTLPILLRWYINIQFIFVKNELYNFLLGLLYVTGTFALLIVLEIIKIFNSLDGKDPFIMENSKSLKRIGILSFLIAISYISKVIFFNSIATMIIVMIFIIAGLFGIIFGELFRQAVEVKQENDYTV